MTFQASNFKGNHFFKLNNDDYLLIKPVYTKNGRSLKSIGHSNSLYVKVTKLITNHASIGEYCLRFFPKENFYCPYRYYPIESRCHIFISFMSVGGIITIGIPIKSLLITSLYSQSLILGHFLFIKESLDSVFFFFSSLQFSFAFLLVLLSFLLLVFSM